ncbi:FGGY-family carbohydrate kinase [Rhizobium wenxiniae]|uniref:FGGY-family carbohydrate kinase n=1 Tax=Rhizobium wenxiniae TaxID=1737357 RepID=UPI001C6E5CF9|nr:FGGY-family carbohydrate kinase [Rhizobium wenxiniae]MBW9089323.1 FGGY-family carbohydrate kinase [Rhizobium wenxiniae]
MTDIFVGIDVGTGSARAGLFNTDGTMLATAKRDITLWKEGSDVVEQSSDNIWTAIGDALREAMSLAAVEPSQVKGIGFDATCSMVIVSADGKPLPASPGGDPQRNVIVWMDHRAVEQARRINEMGHSVLSYVGGRISPEMEVPKLLWLKEHNRKTYDAAAHFFDLPDYLSWRATGSFARSLCTVVCKWTYLGHERRWDEEFFRQAGLSDLADGDFVRIGQDIVDIATPIGGGLTERAAADLGLLPGTPVGASLIDAHAGGVGTIAARRVGGSPSEISERMALILGTSSCTMTVTDEPTFVKGIWGPYSGAMLPGIWLNEGGQSAFGAGIDHLVSMHPAVSAARKEAEAASMSLLGWLEQQAILKAGGIEDAALLARDIHVVPEFLGNRAPDADPEASATLSGLRLDASLDNLIDVFVAGLCGLAYGTAGIVDALTAEDVPIKTMVVSGGAAKSPLLRRLLADATGLTVAIPSSPEPVLLGAAVIAASASRQMPLIETASSMSAIASEVQPQTNRIAEFHHLKRQIYGELKRVDRNARDLMERFRPKQ